MLSSEEVESLRRSQAMAPLGPHHVEMLLEACAQSARERRELAEIVAELRAVFPPVREVIGKMARLSASARDRQMAVVMAGQLARLLPSLRAPLNRLSRLVTVELDQVDQP